jgi:outer membrane lipoprotein-sorting protein
MKKLILLFAFCLFVFPLAAQFTGNMLFTFSGKQMNFKVFNDRNRYRYEFNEDGQEGVVIVLNNSKEVFILMPQQKMAIRSTSTSQMSMSTDPLKIYDYYLEKGGSEKTIGHENVNGYDCLKKELYGENNQLLQTMWFSEKYNFPIKIVSHIDISGKTQMELKDLKPWSPDETKFKIPQGYTVMDQAAMMPEY